MIEKTGDGFVLRESQGISFYSCLAFEKIEGLHHGFSSRRGGAQCEDREFNLGYVPWDLPGHVDENRGRFLVALDLKTTQLATLRQNHSDRVHIIREIRDQWNCPEGDALVTKARSVALAVQVADCLPILIADPTTQAIAAVHSGWRGTLTRIVEKTICTMREAFGCQASSMLVAIGPGIRECCFEVESEVAEKFVAVYPGINLATPSKPGKHLLNLIRAIKTQLLESGVFPENIYDMGACTRCNANEFYSFRACGEGAGRMMAVVGFGD